METNPGQREVDESEISFSVVLYSDQMSKTYQLLALNSVS